MKKSTIVWTISLATVSALFALYTFQFAATPVSFKPNWLTIVPVVVLWAVSIAALMHKALAVAAPRTRRAEAELVMAGEPAA